MGYKSVLRSVNAAANKASRDAERESRRIQKEKERLNKKIAAIEQKMEKIVNALNDQLAKGKVTQEEYTNLLERKADIGLDLIVFGKMPAVSAAKRYICGKIEKEEFKNICSSIVPSEVEMERSEIKKEYDEILSKIEDFKKSCNSSSQDVCQKCGKKKSLLSPIKSVGDLNICGKCRKELRQLTDFRGFTGAYFFVDPHEIAIDGIDNCQLEVNIHPEHF